MKQNGGNKTPSKYCAETATYSRARENVRARADPRDRTGENIHNEARGCAEKNKKSRRDLNVSGTGEIAASTRIIRRRSSRERRGKVEGRSIDARFGSKRSKNLENFARTARTFEKGTKNQEGRGRERERSKCTPGSKGAATQFRGEKSFSEISTEKRDARSLKFQPRGDDTSLSLSVELSSTRSNNRVNN